MTRFLPPCDIKTLQAIESYAPHLLTPADRYALRMHAEAGQRRGLVAVITVAAALASAVALAAVVLA